MPYQTTKPAPNDYLSQSVNDIQGNFAQANTTMNIDHYPFNDLTANNGFHKQVRMPELAVKPVVAANQGALYTKEAQTITNLFWEQENGTEVQMTNIAPVNSASGYTFLPGGMLMQWGTQGASSASSVAVTFPVEFKLAGVANVPYSIQVIPIRAATSPGDTFMVVVVTGSPTSLGFTIGNIGGHSMAGWYWLAIGPKS